MRGWKRSRISELKSAAGTATNLAALVRRICEGSLPKSNLTNSDELSPRPVGPIHGHHLHRPFLIETHHRHLTPHLYHGLAIAWVGSPSRGSVSPGAHASTARHSSPNIVKTS